MAVEKTASKKKAKKTTLTFTKRQLVKSQKYAMERDVLSALLEDKRLYTIDEVDAKLHEFLKGKVKK